MNIKLRFKSEWLQEYKNKQQDLVPAWIYFEHSGEYYPDDDWIDNPAILLGWWLYSMSELLQGREGQGLSFMEGPFYFKAHIEDSVLYLQSEDGNVSWEVDKIEFVKELLSTANFAARKFHEAGLTELSKSMNNGNKMLKSVLLNLEK